MHRDKTTSKGGPDGGDGGRGGHVIIRGNEQLWTLLHLKYQRHIMASHGESGSGNRKHGGDGDDAIIEVPLGTLIKNAETGETEFEITEEGQEYIATPGGRGGLGNDHFKSSTNQAPRYAQPGEDGLERGEDLVGCRVDVCEDDEDCEERQARGAPLREGRLWQCGRFFSRIQMAHSSCY